MNGPETPKHCPICGVALTLDRTTAQRVVRYYERDRADASKLVEVLVCAFPKRGQPGPACNVIYRERRQRDALPPWLKKVTGYGRSKPPEPVAPGPAGNPPDVGHPGVEPGEGPGPYGEPPGSLR